MELSIVIPVYRSAASIPLLHKRLCDACNGHFAGFEIIFVEDCGGDDSWRLIQQLALDDVRIRGLRLTRNFGQHYAITAGMSIARGNWVVTMDCDLQDDPAFISDLYRLALEQKVDMVLVRRVGRRDHWVNVLLSRLFYRCFAALSGQVMDSAVGSYRIMSRRVVKSYLDLPERHRFFGGLIQWMGYATASLDVPHQSRHAGRSGYSFLRRLSLACDALFSFSDRPLLVMVFVGGLTALLTPVFASYIFVRRILGLIPELGFASLIISIYFLSGLILMSLGIVGLYVGRVYHEVKGRPLFLIAEDTGSE